MMLTFDPNKLIEDIAKFHSSLTEEEYQYLDSRIPHKNNDDAANISILISIINSFAELMELYPHAARDNIFIKMFDQRVMFILGKLPEDVRLHVIFNFQLYHSQHFCHIPGSTPGAATSSIPITVEEEEDENFFSNIEEIDTDEVQNC